MWYAVKKVCPDWSSLTISSSSGHFLRLLRPDDAHNAGLAGVEGHHLLGDEGVLPPLGLEVLPGLHQVGVGQHLTVLRHLFNHSLVVTLRELQIFSKYLHIVYWKYFPTHLNGTVVLVDLDAELAAGGEVLWLGQVTLGPEVSLTHCWSAQSVELSTNLKPSWSFTAVGE